MSQIKCFAPWIHSYIGPNDQRALCCQARPFIDSLGMTFEKYWNSSQMKEVRLSFMNGEFPTSCCHCENAVLPDDEYFRKFQKVDTNKILELTSNDGSYKGKPFYLDYRISNICNLSCRTCSADFSSKIERKDIAIGRTSRVTEFNGERLIEFEELALDNKQQCEKVLYFASGESIIQPEHRKLIQEICDKGIAESTKLIYNTNLGYPLNTLEKLEPLFERFKAVELMISFDSYGGAGEFIRDGLIWNQFVQNIKFVTNSSAFTSISFYYVLTLPGLLNIRETLHFLNEYKKPLSVCMVIPKGYAKLLSPFVLSSSDLSKLVEIALVECDREDSEYTRPLRELIKTLEETKQQFPLESLLPLFNYAENLDEAFKRKSLIDFYEGFKQTEKLVFYNGKSFFIDDPYWLEQVKKLVDGQELDHIQFFPVRDNIQKGKSLIIVSKRSWLSETLSRKEIQVFPLEDDLVVEEKIVLGTFSFLLRERPILKRVGSLLDSLTFILSKYIGLHEAYIVNKS